MTKLYTLEIPLRLSVEADTKAEARRVLFALYHDVMGVLPVGAGCFVKEDTFAAMPIEEA